MAIGFGKTITKTDKALSFNLEMQETISASFRDIRKEYNKISRMFSKNQAPTKSALNQLAEVIQNAGEKLQEGVGGMDKAVTKIVNPNNNNKNSSNKIPKIKFTNP